MTPGLVMQLMTKLNSDACVSVIVDVCLHVNGGMFACTLDCVNLCVYGCTCVWVQVRRVGVDSEGDSEGRRKILASDRVVAGQQVEVRIPLVPIVSAQSSGVGSSGLPSLEVWEVVCADDDHCMATGLWHILCNANIQKCACIVGIYLAVGIFLAPDVFITPAFFSCCLDFLTVSALLVGSCLNKKWTRFGEWSCTRTAT